MEEIFKAFLTVVFIAIIVSLIGSLAIGIVLVAAEIKDWARRR